MILLMASETWPLALRNEHRLKVFEDRTWRDLRLRIEETAFRYGG
jgi:hypothetical protein